MTLELAYNTTDSVVLTDEQGYFIGGRSWGPIDSSDPIAAAALEAGRLVKVDEDTIAGAADNADAQAAIAALADRRQRLEQARSLSKDELIDELGDAAETLPKGGDGKPAKDDLVEAVAAAPDGDDKTTTKPRRGK